MIYVFTLHVCVRVNFKYFQTEFMLITWQYFAIASAARVSIATWDCLRALQKINHTKSVRGTHKKVG